MNKLAVISIVCNAEFALRKLKKAKIAVFNCKKEGALFIFSIKDKDMEKVFAIFEKPCYNIKVKQKSAKNAFLSLVKLRAGLVIGAAIFVLSAVFANTFVFKIEISGNGKYLESEVRNIIYSEGAGEFKPYSLVNAPSVTGKILALPQVTFCNIEKRGSVLIVDVRTDGEHSVAVNRKPLVADTDGVVVNIVAVCGTPAVEAGTAVKKGDTLIYAHTLSGEDTVECIAAGYAELECKKVREYFAESESEENLKNAFSSVLLEDEEILERNFTVKPTSGGVIYVIEFTYLHKLSINLS